MVDDEKRGAAEEGMQETVPTEEPVQGDPAENSSQEGVAGEKKPVKALNKKEKTIKIVKTVLWSLLGVFMLLVAIVEGTLLVEKYVKKSPVPMFAGHAYLIVTSDSMHPTINRGDMIIVRKTNNYGRGDIVTFMDGNEIVTHRIIFFYDPETEENNVLEYTGWFRTQGDYANAHGDELDPRPLSEENIYGEVVFTIPKMGLVFNWFTNQFGWIYAVSLLAVVIAGFWLWDHFKGDDDDDEKGKKQEVAGDGSALEGASAEAAPTAETAPVVENPSSEE